MYSSKVVKYSSNGFSYLQHQHQDVWSCRGRFLLARQHRSLSLHLNFHLHPHVLHVWHIVSVSGIEWVVISLPELVDVVEIEKGWQTTTILSDVLQKLLRQRVEVLKFVFWENKIWNCILIALQRLLHHQTVECLSVLAERTTARTPDPSSRGHSTHWCHSAVVGRRACGNPVRASLEYRRMSNTVVFQAHNCRACAVGASLDLHRED